MTKRKSPGPPRRYWSADDLSLLRELYPDTPTAALAQRLGRSLTTTYTMARKIGLEKSEAYRASPASCRLRRGDNVGAATRFPPGHVPANKGLRRPGWHRGNMQMTQFKKGDWPANRDPGFYVLGALRVSTEGYIEMRTSFAPGGMGWRGLHLILWEDAHGPVPPKHCLTFKDGEKLNVELDNIECITRAELARRNSITNLPKPLQDTIRVLGKLKRAIHEKQSRGSAESPVRRAGGAAGQGQSDGSGEGAGDRAGRLGDRQHGEGGERPLEDHGADASGD